MRIAPDAVASAMRPVILSVVREAFSTLNPLVALIERLDDGGIPAYRPGNTPIGQHRASNRAAEVMGNAIPRCQIRPFAGEDAVFTAISSVLLVPVG